MIIVLVEHIWIQADFSRGIEMQKRQLHEMRVLLRLLSSPGEFIRESIRLVGVTQFLNGFQQMYNLGPRTKRRLLIEFLESGK